MLYGSSRWSTSNKQLVDDGVMGGKAVQSFTELEPLLQILGTLPLCLGTSEVGDDD